jgi:hypothetical protein
MGLYGTENAVVLEIKYFKVNLTLLFLCLLEINFYILNYNTNVFVHRQIQPGYFNILF